MSSSLPPVMAAVGRALPPHHASQEELIHALRALWATQHFNLERLEELHRNVRVGGRHLALPVHAYEALTTFQQRNDAWIAAALELGEQVARRALDAAGLTPRDVDHVFFATVTGIATPSIEARLVNRMGLRTDVKRTPIFGLGCVAGAAGLARAADYLRAFPRERALLLCVELCSLTLQREDLSIPNIIASGLFGDGAAAVLLEGGLLEGGLLEGGGDGAGPGRSGSPRGPRVVASRSVFYPGTERVMGWDVADTGFKVVLNAQVPQLVRTHVGGNVDAFLAAHGLTRGDVRHWVAHTGGPRVLEAFEETLALPAGALARSWESLRSVGNLSSASVLFVLGELLEAREAREGDYGLLLAMGPGFCAELVLLQW